MKSNSTSSRGQTTSETARVQEPPDGVEEAEGWLFIVPSNEKSGILARCRASSKPGLDVVTAGSRAFKHAIKDAKKILVVTPTDERGHAEAKGILAACRGKPGIVAFPWDVDGLGEGETPDLASYDKQWGLARQLAVAQPWTGRIAIPDPQTNGNGRQIYLPNGRLNYAELTDEEVGITWGSAIKIKPIRWLWKYRIAAGEMTLIAGMPGYGKSQVMLSIAAAITTGSPWPIKEGIAPMGSVAILSAEDDPENTIMPRLHALGADVDKILILRANVRIEKKDKEAIIHPRSLQDLDWWRRSLAVKPPRPPVVMVIADPLPSYLGPNVNDQRNTEIRAVVEPFLSEIVRPLGISFLANTHLNKQIDAKSPLNRISGSTAYGALPRNVHFVIEDPDDEDFRCFKQGKCNNAPENLPAVRFQCKPRILRVGELEIETSVPIFDPEPYMMDLKHALSGEKTRRGPKPEKTNRVAEWLFGLLKERPLLLKEIWSAAEHAGHIKPSIEGKKNPSKAIVYDAREVISLKYPGYRIEQMEIEPGVGQSRPRVMWQLLRPDANDRPAAAAPF